MAQQFKTFRANIRKQTMRQTNLKANKVTKYFQKDTIVIIMYYETLYV